MVRELVIEWVQDSVAFVKSNKYVKYGSLAVFFVLLITGSWAAKNWYVASRESKAQLAFSDALDSYQTALYYAIAKADDKGAIEDHIKDALADLSSVIDKHSGSVLADYAQAFIADLYTLKDEHDRALETINKALSHMSNNSPLYYTYKTKAALLLFENKKDAEGISALQALIVDTKNKQSDDAAYYLGSYYWAQGEYQDAAQVWQRFNPEVTATQDARTLSPWVSIVQQKLAQIS